MLVSNGTLLNLGSHRAFLCVAALFCDIWPKLEQELQVPAFSEMVNKEMNVPLKHQLCSAESTVHYQSCFPVMRRFRMEKMVQNLEYVTCGLALASPLSPLGKARTCFWLV